MEAPESTPHSAVEQAAIAAVSLAWKQAYNARDLAAVTALYAEDARLSAPGLPLVDGREAITDYFAEHLANAATSGLSVEDAPLGGVVTSGDLGWQWQTFRMRDDSGAELGSGQLVTLFRRVDGAWKIAGDTWTVVDPRLRSD
jgi:uncharacterized protein (TIGR02246 family)